MQHNSNNEVLDQGVFDFIDTLVDVPLDELACDLEFPFLPSSVPADGSETPAQGSQNFGNETHGQQSVPQFETNRSEHDREIGRRSQRRFRERKKAQWEKLQAELAETKAALKRLQSQKNASHTVSASAEQAHTRALSIHQSHHVALQAPEMITREVLRHLMQTPWTSGALLTCSLPRAQEDACHHVALLSNTQLAVIAQGYITQITDCLMSSGQDTGGKPGMRLLQLYHEFCCLHSARARVAPRQWRQVVERGYSTGDADAAPALPSPDWAYLTRIMQVEPAQEATILKLRQQLVANLALVSSRRQQLLHQLQSTPQALGVDSREFGSNLGVVDAITEQLQGCVTQEDELFFDYLTTISLTVGTLWQSCVATVHNFPLFPDIVAHANFLADQAGEPSVQELHVAAMATAAGPRQGAMQQHSSMRQAVAHADIGKQAQQELGVIIELHEVRPQDIFEQA